MSHRILLVEDDKKLSQLIGDFFVAQNFVVKLLPDGQNLAQHIDDFEPHVLILDIMLPFEDGFSLCKQVRQSYQGALLFLTAKSSDFDHVLGLELGADDYVIKPVEPRVLLARVQALLRRSEQGLKAEQSKDLLCFGQLHIDKASRQVKIADELITMTSHEFDMLCLLASHPAEVVTRDTIYQQLIGREYDGLDRSADVRISRIRKKLYDNPQNPFKIKTIWGKGFYFVPDAWEGKK